MLSSNCEYDGRVNGNLRPFGCQVAIQSAEELSQLSVKDLVLKNRLLLIRGMKPMAGQDFLNLVASIAGGLDNLLRWDFGYLMEVKEDPAKDNYLFSKEAVPMHWDGAFHISPFILAFQCVEAAGNGGATTFCDSTRIWNAATDRERNEWSGLILNLKTEKKAHYGGELTVNMVGRHPVSNDCILRFAERVTSLRNPVEVKLEGESSCDWLEELPKRLYDPAHCFTHEWQPGDILFADNHALLHGRQAFNEREESGRRCLQRVQILR